ncbi:YadA C-terminal domain-containing protein [Vibrio penaeicida]|uniref:YadA C-terminal domain-containing protein n=1 Tax=Vibrio penaeicida TaxID=104609 RepID=UPI000CE9B3F6|nr:YadA C-terminal domain-containing protein [Vibrio penaeicida]
MKKTVLALSVLLLPATVMANVDRPIKVDPDFGVPAAPVQPPIVTPEHPIEEIDPEFGVPANPVQPPMDNTPDWGIDAPDYGSTPDWGVPTTGVGDLEIAFDKLAQEMNERFDEQSEQIHGIRAGLHAVTNARPFVTTGEFAMGAGVGFSGSKEALALGGAYGVSDRVSVSGTFHYESSGKYSSSEVAGGVGVQFKFK